jgi:hypothetical protein
VAGTDENNPGDPGKPKLNFGEKWYEQWDGPQSAMHGPEISKIIRAPLFRAGIAVQCLSAALIATILLAIRLQWIEVVSIGLEGGIDEPSPKMEALHRAFLGLVLAFACGFVFYGLVFYRHRNAPVFPAFPG